MSEEKEKVVEKVPWIWVIPGIIILTLVFCYVGTFAARAKMYYFNGWGSWSGANAWQWSPGAQMMVTLLLLPVLFRIKFFRERVTIATTLWAYAIGWVASLRTGIPQWVALFCGFNRVRFIAQETQGILIPEWFIPNVKYMELTLTGGPLDWNVWLPVWFSHSFWVVAINLFCFACVTLFHRQWIDVQRLPFPVARATVEPVNLVLGAESESKSRRIQMFKVGLVLGALFYLPLWLNMIFPQFPDLYGWTSYPPWFSPWSGGALCLPDVFPALRVFAGLNNFCLNPTLWALAYLIPTDIQFSIWFMWFIIYIVITQILFAFGYYSNAPQATSGWGRWGLVYNAPPMFWAIQGLAGGLPLLVLLWFVFNRHYVITTVKIALGKATKEEMEWEKDQPLPYKYCYIFLIISMIMLGAFFAAWTVTLPTMLLLFALYFVTYAFGWVYINGFAGMFPMASTPGFWLLARWPSITMEQRNMEFMFASVFTRVPQDDIMSWNVTGGILPANVYSFARVAGVSSRSVFKVLLFSITITPFIVYGYDIVVVHAWGGLNTLPVIQEWNLWSLSMPESWNSIPLATAGYMPWYVYALIGAIITGVLYFLRVRFPWWPIDPIGFIVNCDALDVGFAFTTACIPAWILKVLTFRIGGTKLYNEVGLPLAVGFICGTTLIHPLLSMPFYTLRYFFPA